MKYIVVIPARFESSRFPGKPLVDILGKSLIRRVWEKCAEAVGGEKVFVATDDQRIADHCQKQGMQFVMTSSQCLTGTDRVFEVSQKMEADVLINVQGDEPLLNPADILKVIETAAAHPGEIINAMCPIVSEEDFRSPSVPKVVAAPDGNLLYMSRGAIPTDKKFAFAGAMKQVCIYAFPRKLLEAYGKRASKTPLEAIEDIEILRFLEMGYKVRMIGVSQSSIAVDFPADVEKVKRALTSSS